MEVSLTKLGDNKSTIYTILKEPRPNCEFALPQHSIHRLANYDHSLPSKNEFLCFNFRKRMKFPLCQIHKVLRLRLRSRKLAGQYPEEEVFGEPSEANDRESAAEGAYTGGFRVFEKHCSEALFDLRFCT